MERMKKEKESGTLLGVGTAYLPAKEIKGEFYVKVSDFNRCMDGIRKELEGENKKLKSDLEECECSMHFENDEVGYRKRECKKLKEEIKSRQEEVERFKTNAMQDMSEITELEIENKKLKEKVETLELWLDNKEKLNEEYRKQIDKYKRQYQHSMGFSDFGGYDE